MTNYAIDRKKWGQMPLTSQLANIGAEVGRTYNAARVGNDKRMNAAMERTLDLFDATVAELIAQQSPRTKEILRAREMYLAALFGPRSEARFKQNEKYFMQFAAIKK
ncbi:MAG: hypothetical protein LBI43_05755 [Streptococcaceae bacterium]|jgi:hypothetical protein|nr:hypothetical protein [Streptococcaceae bacterium]